MTRTQKQRVTLIVAADDLSAANNALLRAGFGPENFSTGSGSAVIHHRSTDTRNRNPLRRNVAVIGKRIDRPTTAIYSGGDYC